MHPGITRSHIPSVAAVALLAAACDAPVSRVTQRLSGPSMAASAASGMRITGGGRIDPWIGKTTFGFTVDGSNGPPFKGQMQVVFHLGLLKAHSLTINEFDPPPDENGESCATWRGTVRTSDGHTHEFRAKGCDNGEPGSSPGKGPDKFGICVEQHFSTDRNDPFCDPNADRDPEPTPLTGGNIQLH